MAAETVVVVEDDENLAALVATCLESLGLRVETAADGREALELVTNDPPDAIVLDLHLPRVNGIQVVKHCRQNPSTQDVPIIVTSGSRDALAEPVLDSLVYVEKPFDLDVLGVLVEDAVSSGA